MTGVRPLLVREKNYVDTILYPAIRVGLVRDFGWVSLVCCACLTSDFGLVEPKEGRKLSYNPLLLKDNIDWAGDVVNVESPIMLFKNKIAKRIIKYRRYNSYDDCFNDFITLIKTEKKVKDLSSFRSIGFCVSVYLKGILPITWIDSMSKTSQIVMRVQRIRNYLKEKKLIGKVLITYESEEKDSSSC